MDKELNDTLQLIIGKLGEMDSNQRRMEKEMKSEIVSQVAASNNQIMAYLENTVNPAIKAIADGHTMLAEKLSRIDDMANDIDEIKGAIAAIESATVRNQANIIELQKVK